MNKLDIYFKSLASLINEKIKIFFSDTYYRDNIVRVFLIFALMLCVASLSLAVFSFKIHSYEVPIRYNSFLGVTRLGSWYDLYRFPLFLILISVVNILLGKAIYKKDKFLSYLLLTGIVIVGVMTIIIIINFGGLVK